MCKKNIGIFSYCLMVWFLITVTDTASDRPKREPNWEANVNVKFVDDTSAMISWDFLKDFRRYHVTYKPINIKVKTEIITTSSRSVVLKKLKPNTEYTSYIMTGTSSEKFKSYPVTFKTLVSACPQNVKVQSLGFDSVAVTWDAPMDGVKKYDIMYKPVDFLGTKVKTTQYQSAVLDKLAIGIPYSMNIVAVKSTKRYSSRQIIFRTFDPVEFYGVNQFDDLEVDDLNDFVIPNRPQGFDYYAASTELSEKLRVNDDMFSITVSRSNIVKDTFAQLERFYVDRRKLKSSLTVHFFGEHGTDTGGLTKEWFSIFSKEVFDPKFGLFVYSDENSSVVEINPLSNTRQLDHLLYFELIGMFTGMALCNERFLEAYFSIPFLRTLMHRPISLNDVQLTDPEFYRSLIWVRDHDPAVLKSKFIAPDSKKGNIIKLMKNGDKIKVTEKNKLKFIRLLINHKYIRRVQVQMAAFLMGFTSIIPLDYLDKFNENELQVMIGGTHTIDLKYWKDCTRYVNGYHPNSVQIEWFWEAIGRFDDNQKSRLLQFVTGSPRFSYLGSRKFEFVISRLERTDRLPRAATCFNKLYLPAYESSEKLFEMLSKVTEFTSEYALDTPPYLI